MKRLTTIVEAKRTENDAMFRKMAEEYVKKAAEILTEYLKNNPEKASSAKFAIPIKNLKFITNEVEVSSEVCYLERDMDYSAYISPENCSDWVFDQHMNGTEVLQFINALRNLGFDPLWSEEIDNCEKLYPFFSVN